jgi:hypothetical protein
VTVSFNVFVLMPENAGDNVIAIMSESLLTFCLTGKSQVMERSIGLFLRQNILVILAIPPIIAGTIGIYAKMIREPRPLPSNNNTVQNSDKLKD